MSHNPSDPPEPDYQSLKDTLAEKWADAAFDNWQDPCALESIIMDDGIPAKVLARFIRGDGDANGDTVSKLTLFGYVRDYYRTKVTTRDCDEYLAEQAREAAEDDRNVQWDRENGR